MKLEEILKSRGLKDQRIKVVRHTMNRSSTQHIMESGAFEDYQSYQKSNVFKDADYIISFLALEGKKAILYGVYKIDQVLTTMSVPDR